MTFKEAISYAAAKLSAISDSAKLDAQLLVCHVCNIDQTKIIAYPEQELSDEEFISFNLLGDRRNQGEPLAYIMGEKEFWSLGFIVNEHVLIPRPETELLIEITLDLITGKQSPRILDLGTGSGAIAVSIAKQRSDCTVVATDISEPALEVAKLNAEKHKVSIQFIHSDWYQKLGTEKFDVIVCNPPYVAEQDPHLHQHVTKFESSKAVISKNNGLYDLELVITSAHQYLRPDGSLVIEHGFQQATRVRQLFERHGFKQAQTHKDLAKLDRTTFGKL